MSKDEKTLKVDRWRSTCGACKRDADPKEKGHYRLLGYGPDNGKPGCGVEWEYIQANYVGPNAEQQVKSLRPDLKFIDPYGRETLQV